MASYEPGRWPPAAYPIEVRLVVVLAAGRTLQAEGRRFETCRTHILAADL